MLTFETRVNGTMISHIYARRLGDVNEKKTKYVYEYYQIGEGPNLIIGIVEHDWKGGANSLLSIIIDDIKSKQVEAAK